MAMSQDTMELSDVAAHAAVKRDAFRASLAGMHGSLWLTREWSDSKEQPMMPTYSSALFHVVHKMNDSGKLRCYEATWYPPLITKTVLNLQPFPTIVLQH